MKVCVVGLGINGSYLAYKLAQKGEDVTIFEKKKEIGGKPCSGLISERIWGYLPKTEGLVHNEIDFVKIHYPKKSVKVDFNPKMLSFDRLALEKYIIKLAKKEGADVKLGKSVKLEYLNDFDRVIGCDGAVSNIRRGLGVKDPKYRLGVYVHKKEITKSDHVETWPTKNGFCWKIPKGKFIEYGCMDSVERAKFEFEKFCSPRGKIKSSLIPEGVRTSNDNRVFLCGDSAGLTKPWSGGGVIWGFVAGDMLVNCFPNVQQYNNQIKKFFGGRFLIYNSLTRGVSLASGLRLLPSKRTIDSDFLFKFLKN